MMLFMLLFVRLVTSLVAPAGWTRGMWSAEAVTDHSQLVRAALCLGPPENYLSTFSFSVMSYSLMTNWSPVASYLSLWKRLLSADIEKEMRQPLPDLVTFTSASSEFTKQDFLWPLRVCDDSLNLTEQFHCALCRWQWISEKTAWHTPSSVLCFLVLKACFDKTTKAALNGTWSLQCSQPKQDWWDSEVAALSSGGGAGCL